MEDKFKNVTNIYELMSFDELLLNQKELAENIESDTDSLSRVENEIYKRKLNTQPTTHGTK